MKFFGKVGYCETQAGTGERLGISEDVVVEREYYGDVLENHHRWEQQSDSVLDNLNVSNKISIVADAVLYNHISTLKYIEWMGTKWKVKDIEIRYPRLILQIGGVYNGPTTGTPQYDL